MKKNEVCAFFLSFHRSFVCFLGLYVSFFAKKGWSRENLSLEFPSHLSELNSHSDFKLLEGEFEAKSLDERFEAVKFAFLSLDSQELASSTLREPLKIALFKELLVLLNFDFTRVSSLIIWDSDLYRKLVKLRGHDLLLENGLIKEAIQLRIALTCSFKQRVQFSNPRDAKLIDFLRCSPDQFFMVFDEINAETLPVLLYSNPKDELLLE